VYDLFKKKKNTYTNLKNYKNFLYSMLYRYMTFKKNYIYVREEM